MEEDKKLKEKKDLAKAAVASGAGLATIGGTTYGLGKVVEHTLKTDKKGRVMRGVLKSSAKYGVTPETLTKNLKKGGKVSMAIGTPVLAVGAYKHYKYKKNDKDADTEK